ncbi:PREDICTED: transmembrane protein 230-like [Brassica oleracea var. oleracea]|uniref:transmembrane protein 230-like n=1 Tax=Brassica oleracea var. oleracea TaxID=109376 RepID=UPI0006A6EBE1|nr:PREDICTED: transmembrane protein 230-like [Brassica oleracea var. oleracea]
MAYVDHAFSISDEDLMIGTSYTVSNRPPVKEISLAVALLLFGIVGIVSGFFMAYRGHGVFFIVFGCLVFIPGFYYTRIAYYAYKGYKGFSFSSIPSA